MNKDEITLDVTFGDLINPTGKDSPLRSLFEEINCKWIGPFPVRAFSVRVGSVHISNGPDGTGNGVITIRLRTPLDLTKVRP